MSRFARLRVLVALVIVFSYIASPGWCATLQQNKNGTDSASRQGRQRDGNSAESFSVSPALSYQFHTNDHEHLDRIVESHQQQQSNGFVNSFTVDEAGAPRPAVDRRSSDGITQAPRTRFVYPVRSEPLVQTATASSYFPSASKQAEEVSTARALLSPSSQDLSYLAVPRQVVAGRTRPGAAPGQQLQRRQDSYGGMEQEDHHHFFDHGDGQFAPGQGLAGAETYEHDHEHDHDDGDDEYFGLNGANAVQDALEEEPALRDFGEGKPGGGFGGGPGGGGGGFGVGVGNPQPPGLPPPIPGFPGPIPPPPGPLKGSIDYILIPLILIGLAGPIFVVLYVILGGFEYRLAPIVRRSMETSYFNYQPYLDGVTTGVGRALEKYECSEYTLCRVRALSSQLGLSGSTATSVEQMLSSVTPSDYQSSVRRVFSVLKAEEGAEAQDCNRFKCSSLLERLPLLGSSSTSS